MFGSVWGVLFRVFFCRFFGVWDASGHHFGGIFVTFGGPGPPWAPFGTSLGHFGRPGGEKGRNMEIPPHEIPHPLFTLLGTFALQSVVFLWSFSGTRFSIDFSPLREGLNLTKYCACQQNQRFGVAASRLHPGSILRSFWRPLGTLFVFFCVFWVSNF